MFEQFGIAPFSVDRVNVDDDELKVFGSLSISTYCINWPLLLVVLLYDCGDKFVFPNIVKSPLTLYIFFAGVYCEVLWVKPFLICASAVCEFAISKTITSKRYFNGLLINFRYKFFIMIYVF
jgi:hypothetical protein